MMTTVADPGSSGVVDKPHVLAIPKDSLPRGANRENLSATITAPDGTEIPVPVIKQSDGVHLGFTPSKPGVYFANVFNEAGERIATIPIAVTSEPPVVGSTTSVPVSSLLQGYDPEKVNVVVRDQEGNIVPAKITIGSDGQVKVEFDPSVPGTHTVQLLDENNNPISQFSVNVASEALPTVGSDVSVPLKTDLPAGAKVEVRDPLGNLVDSYVTHGGDGDNVNFQPNIPGKYTVSMYDAQGNKIGEMPVEVTPVMKSSTAGEPVVAMIPKESFPEGKAPKKVIVKDAFGNEIPTALLPTEDGYALKFTPENAGAYSATFLDEDGNPLLTVPLVVGPSSKDPVVGIPVQTTIPSDLLGNELPSSVQVEVFDPSGRKVDVKAIPKGDSLEVQFSPLSPGVYTAQIFDKAGKKIGEIPISVGDGKKEQPSIPVAGKPVQTTVPIPPTQTPLKDLIVEVTDQTGKVIPSHLIPGVSGDSVDVGFTPNLPGTYKVRVMDPKGNVIADTKVEVAAPTQVVTANRIDDSLVEAPVDLKHPKEKNVQILDPSGRYVPGTLVEEDGKVKLQFEPTLPGLYRAEIHDNAGNEIKVIPINVPDVPSGKSTEGPRSTGISLDRLGVTDPSKLSLTVKDPNGNIIPSQLVIKDKDVYVEFTPTMPGTYLAELFEDGTKIADIPFVIPGDDEEAPNTTTTKLPLEELGIDDPSQLSIILKDPTGEVFPSELKIKENEAYLDFLPLKSGVYVAELYVDGNKISEIPINVNIPEQETIVLPANLGYALLPVELGTEIIENVDVAVVSPTGDVLGRGRISEKDGETVVEFPVPKVAGDYKLQLQSAAKDLQGTPIALKVTPSPKIQIVGESKVLLHEPTQIDIETIGIDPSAISIVTKGPQQNMPSSLNRNDDGTFRIHFTPDIPGTYNVEILVDGQKKFVIPINLEPVPMTEQPPISVEAGSKNVLIPFEAEGVVVDRIRPHIRKPDGTYVSPAQIVSDGDSKAVQFDAPTELGPYNLHLVIDGKDLPSSPIPFEVNLAPEVEVLDVPKSSKVGEPTTLKLKTSGIDPKDLTCAVVNPSKSTIPTKLALNRDGTYDLVFVPQTPGTYHVEVGDGKTVLSIVPIVIDLDVKEVPSQQAEVVALGEVAKVKVSKDLDFDDLFMSLFDPDGVLVPKAKLDSAGKIVFIPEKQGTFAAKFTDSKGQVVHTELIAVNIEESTDKSSPVKRPPTVRLGGEPNISALGEPVTIPLLIENIDPTKIGVSVLDPSGNSIPSTLVGTGKPSTLTFIPNIPGNHVVTLLNERKEPFVTFPIDISPELPQANTPYPSIQHPIPHDLSKYNLSELSVILKGPVTITGVLVKMPNGDPGVRFSPPLPGTYQCQVYKDNQPILKSPFPIVISPEDVPLVVIGADHVVVVGGLITNTGKSIADLVSMGRDIKAFLVSPKNDLIPGELISLSEGDPHSLAVSWVPPGIGTYTLQLLDDKKPLVQGIKVDIVVGKVRQQSLTNDEIEIDLTGVIFKLDPITNTNNVPLPYTADDILVEMKSGEVVVKGQVSLIPQGVEITLQPKTAGRYTVQIYYMKDRTQPILSSSPTLLLKRSEPSKKGIDMKAQWIDQLKQLTQRLQVEIDALEKYSPNFNIKSIEEFKQELASRTTPFVNLKNISWENQLQKSEEELFLFYSDLLRKLLLFVLLFKDNLSFFKEQKYIQFFIKNFSRSKDIINSFLEISTNTIQSPDRLQLQENHEALSQALQSIVVDSLKGLNAYHQYLTQKSQEQQPQTPRQSPSELLKKLQEDLQSDSTPKATICGDTPIPRNLRESINAYPTFVKALFGAIQDASPEKNAPVLVQQMTRLSLFLKCILLEQLFDVDSSLANKMVPFIEQLNLGMVYVLKDILQAQPAEEHINQMKQQLAQVRDILKQIN
eukprot:TRINITY_DN6592_c0_g2_i2.p1 TRINITY_DN6592_c0_g2~~TRINITY_DN6592_c0_g2_i2.p1  ORF type:complete len:2155 (+),score=679.01 TRINITY_DN6592_c0_g2_i2:757-6465(+)